MSRRSTSEQQLVSVREFVEQVGCAYEAVEHHARALDIEFVPYWDHSPALRFEDATRVLAEIHHATEQAKEIQRRYEEEQAAKIEREREDARRERERQQPLERVLSGVRISTPGDGSAPGWTAE
jgi:hypothetical protein